MCIALLSTAHPSYSLILISNRDEFLNRPTAPASWWPEPHSHVLGGRDLHRPVQGTWLGITKQGRIAVLTNFKEEGPLPQGKVSRGAIIRAFLTDCHSGTEAFVREMLSSGVSRDAGGFSLVCGNVGQPLAVMSNRAASEAEIPWIHPGSAQTVGLSNAAYGDNDWKKVMDGERMLREAVKQSLDKGESEDDFIQRLLKLLSTDTLPRLGQDGDFETYIAELRNTVFVPPIGHLADWRADEIAAAAKEGKAFIPVKKEQVLGVNGIYEHRSKPLFSPIILGRSGYSNARCMTAIAGQYQLDRVISISPLIFKDEITSPSLYGPKLKPGNPIFGSEASIAIGSFLLLPFLRT